MPSVQDYLDMWDRLEGADLKLDQARCVSVRNRNAGCLRCATACASGCISCEDNVLRVAPEKCIGCGTCSTICPTGALSPREPTDVQLAKLCGRAMDATSGHLVITCEKMLERGQGFIDPAKAVGVACIGRVDESLIVSAVAHGATRVSIVKGPCDTCDYKRGERAEEIIVQTAREILRAWSKEGLVSLRDKMPACTRIEDDEFDHAKRGFFMGMKGSATSAAAMASEYAQEKVNGPQAFNDGPIKVQEDGTLPHWLPERHKRLINAMRELGTPAEGAHVKTHLWGHVEIDLEECASCYMCATFCPTGALLKIDEENMQGIAHRSAACVYCGCCWKICPKHAVRLTNDVPVDDILTGRVVYFPMRPDDRGQNGPDTMLKALQKLMKLDNTREA